MSSPEVLRARRILDRLKRGVPPTEGLDELAVGMDALHARLRDLLGPAASPRWLAVQSEYGEGKSHFHSFARHHALRADYAVASLDVNKDDGALHQPQRHLALLFDSLRSPRADFSEHHGLGAIVRAWLELTPRTSVVEVLQRCRSVCPHTPAGWDPGHFSYYADLFIRSGNTAPARGHGYESLLRFFSAEDLTSRSSAARFAAAYRLQVVLEWLLATGHRGLLLFIDEVDNVVRQIHGKGHPGCFRTLAWYCSCPGLPHLRTVFASTPEVLDRLDHGEGEYFLRQLRSQQTVRQEEVSVYEGWLRVMERQARSGWQRCPLLSVPQRVDLFQRIAALHQVAWGSRCFPNRDEVTNLARQPMFPTSRRWVRAAVQILDLMNYDGRVRESATIRACEKALA